MFNLKEDKASIHIAHGETPLFTYTFATDYSQDEFNRPYLHPIRTLAGDVVTNDRPTDHPWHKGLSLTLTVINEENFWGGKTYVHGEGYVPKDNVGSTVHREWIAQPSSALESITLAHKLDWLTAKGDTWMHEERSIRCADVDADQGYWSLTWHSRLENVSGIPLSIGSPTTKGRTAAGYGGLFWRGARDLHGGSVMADGDLSGEDTVNGAKARWIAFSGKHDGSLQTSTVILTDHPQNPRYPNPWFVRSTQYAGISAAFAYHETYTLAPEDVLDLSYRLIVANGEASRESINQVVDSLE